MVEFRVLRCAHCQTFQVLQVTKSPKWKCKMCGEKQSVLKEYGRGTGADCRRHVQKLNTARMTIEKATDEYRLDSALSKSDDSVSSMHEWNDEIQKYDTIEQNQSSRWEAFMENENKEMINEDGSHPSMCFAGRNEEDICITTDWSELKLKDERRQYSKNKRKLQQDAGSKWNKVLKRDDDEDQSYSHVNKAHGRNFVKGYNSSSSFESKPSRTLSSKYRDSGSSALSCDGKKARQSQHCSHNGLSGSRFHSSPRSGHLLTPKTKTDLNPSHGRNQIPHSKSKETVTPLGFKTDHPKLPIDLSNETTTKSSKWSNFMIDNNDNEEDSDVASDDDDSFQTFTTADGTDSRRVRDSLKGVIRLEDNHSNSVSRWNTFVEEKEESDERECFDDSDYDNTYNSNNSCVENVSFDKEHNGNIRLNPIHHVNRLSVQGNAALCFDSAANAMSVKKDAGFMKNMSLDKIKRLNGIPLKPADQVNCMSAHGYASHNLDGAPTSMKEGDTNFGMKSKHSNNLSINDVGVGVSSGGHLSLPQTKGLGSENKSLFRVREDDDLWDVDL